ncbi:MAG: hypothetical protein NC911_09990 [Candidatus Omnitrophica bacterium]|nr:hypothetical protein [Candidatus Omnitrophota bacterium]
MEKSEMMEAKRILISITGSPDLTLFEVQEAMDMIQTRISADTREVGVTLDAKLKNEVKITLLATGLGKPSGEARKEEKPSRQQATLLTEENQEMIDLPPMLRKQIVNKKGEAP